MRKPQGKIEEVRKEEKNFLLCKFPFGEEARKKRKEKKRKEKKGKEKKRRNFLSP